VDYTNVMLGLGLSVLAIVAGVGLLYGTFAKWRKWQSEGPSRPRHLSARERDMRQEGQQLNSD
jgi:hypothetical protein